MHLAELGHDVAVLERAEVASAASGQNMGGLGGSGRGEPRDLEDRLTRGGVAVFQRLQEDLGYDIELRLSGTVQAIQTEEEFAFARDRVLAARRAGHDLELLSAREARGIEPALNPALPGAVYAGRSRGQADPVKATRAFADAARNQGAALFTGREVTGIRADAGGSFRVETRDRVVAAGALVLAAGAWCRPLARLLGLDVPIMPVRGQMWATKPLPPRVFHTVSATESPLAWSTEPVARPGLPPHLTHDGERRLTRHLYGRQNARGEVIFGGDRRSVGYDADPDAAGIASNRAHAEEVLPFLAGVDTARTWSGLMPFSIDGAPLIGALPGHDNLYIVGGMGGSGFGRGAMAGKLLAETIHEGQPLPLLKDADPARCVTTL